MLQFFATGLALVFPALVIVAAVKDVTSFTIPNWIPLALAAAFPAAALTAGVPLPDLALHGAVGVAALVLAMILFALRWVGGGDAKLLAAAALWLGWPQALVFLMVTAIAGGALALALLGLRSPMLRPITTLGPAWFTRLASPGENVPYGVAIAMGALFVYPQSPLIAAALSL